MYGFWPSEAMRATVFAPSNQGRTHIMKQQARGTTLL